MAHIGIDSRLTYYRDGGISTYIRRLLEALEQTLPAEHQLTVFRSRKAHHTPQKGRFDHARLWTPAHHRIERSALSLELAWRNLDIFHSPDFIPPHYGARHHVITVHDLTFLHYPQYLTEDSRNYYNRQIKAACRHANAILAVSEATKQDLIAMLHVPEGKIHVQPHGVDAQYRPLPATTIGSVLTQLQLPGEFFLHVGTWEPRKNILGLMQGYKHLLDNFPDAPPIVLVGRAGWLFEETRQKIEALGIHEHILWRDHVTDSQLPAVYNAALASFSPSFYEGFGMPALEAMACGTVPVVSNRSSLPEVIGDVGLLIDPDDPISIAQAMKRILTDSTWVDAQTQVAIQRAALFTWENSAKIALRAYTSTL